MFIAEEEGGRKEEGREKRRKGWIRETRGDAEELDVRQPTGKQGAVLFYKLCAL